MQLRKQYSLGLRRRRRKEQVKDNTNSSIIVPIFYETRVSYFFLKHIHETDETFFVHFYKTLDCSTTTIYKMINCE